VYFIIFQIGAIALTSGEFAEEHRVLALSDVACLGTEQNLLNCSYSRLPGSQCGPREDAGVVCQCKKSAALTFITLHEYSSNLMCVTARTTPAGDCTSNTLRLVNGTMNDTMQTLDGRLEICINNAWGTICSNSFRLVDAEVACNHAIGFDRIGWYCYYFSFCGFTYQNCSGSKVISPRSYLSSGPIFLDQLACTGSDSNLLECSRGGQILGLASCNHTQDVWVECKGNLLGLMSFFQCLFFLPNRHQRVCSKQWRL